MNLWLLAFMWILTGNTYLNIAAEHPLVEVLSHCKHCSGMYRGTWQSPRCCLGFHNDQASVGCAGQTSPNHGGPRSNLQDLKDLMLMPWDTFGGLGESMPGQVRSVLVLWGWPILGTWLLGKCPLVTFCSEQSVKVNLFENLRDIYRGTGRFRTVASILTRWFCNCPATRNNDSHTYYRFCLSVR